MVSPGVRYSGPAIVLHWLGAAAMAAVLVLPVMWEWIDGMPIRDLINLHKSFGVVVLVVAVVRIGWRWISPPPDLPDGTASWVRLSALAGHAALYALMMALPVIGVLFSWANGRPVPVFGLFDLPAPFAPDRALGGNLADIHVALGLYLLPLVLLAHIGAALWHHYIVKDGLLDRMSPFPR